MPDTEAIDLIQQIKRKVAALEWNEDHVAMDNYCGEIDSLMYKLRSVVIPPPVRIARPGEFAKSKQLGLDELLAEIGEDFVP